MSSSVLRVSEVKEENRWALSLAVTGWQKLAEKKGALVEEGDLSFYCCFEACSWMIGSLKISLEGRATKAYDCVDGEGRLQAVAIHDPENNYLHWLVTHPNNIRHKINEDLPGRVSGAGTAIILKLVENSLRKDPKPLRLTAFSEAVGFYKKLKFDSPDQLQPMKMELTVEKMRQLVVSRFVA